MLWKVLCYVYRYLDATRLCKSPLITFQFPEALPTLDLLDIQLYVRGPFSSLISIHLCGDVNFSSRNSLMWQT